MAKWIPMFHQNKDESNYCKLYSRVIYLLNTYWVEKKNVLIYYWSYVVKIQILMYISLEPQVQVKNFRWIPLLNSRAWVYNNFYTCTSFRRKRKTNPMENLLTCNRSWHQQYSISLSGLSTRWRSVVRYQNKHTVLQKHWNFCSIHLQRY